MNDIHIRIHHHAHWEWVVPVGRIGDDEETIQTVPDHPEIVKVKRLVPDDNFTDLVIPGESAQLMAEGWAGAEGVAPTDRHLHEILTKHVEETMRRDHAPSTHWHKVESTHAPLQKVLHRRFIAEVE